MVLEVTLSERISRCENCGRIILSPVIIEGHSFCSNLCYDEWARAHKHPERKN